jgi:hypothetical protein
MSTTYLRLEWGNGKVVAAKTYTAKMGYQRLKFQLTTRS